MGAFRVKSHLRNHQAIILPQSHARACACVAGSARELALPSAAETRAPQRRMTVADPSCSPRTFAAPVPRIRALHGPLTHSGPVGCCNSKPRVATAPRTASGCDFFTCSARRPTGVGSAACRRLRGDPCFTCIRPPARLAARTWARARSYVHSMRFGGRAGSGRMVRPVRRPLGAPCLCLRKSGLRARQQST